MVNRYGEQEPEPEPERVFYKWDKVADFSTFRSFIRFTSAPGGQ